NKCRINTGNHASGLSDLGARSGKALSSLFACSFEENGEYSSMYLALQAHRVRQQRSARCFDENSSLCVSLYGHTMCVEFPYRRDFDEQERAQIGRNSLFRSRAVLSPTGCWADESFVRQWLRHQPAKERNDPPSSLRDGGWRRF
ncbi:MAG: hypothetical protein ACI8W7_000984, partial [Gammaproteobacteria bacterium]